MGSIIAASARTAKARAAFIKANPNLSAAETKKALAEIKKREFKNTGGLGVGETFKNVAKKTVKVAGKLASVASIAAPGLSAGLTAVSGSGIFGSATGAGNSIPAYVDQLNNVVVPKASAGTGIWNGLVSGNTGIMNKSAQVLPGPAAQFVGSGEWGVEVGSGGIQVKVPSKDNTGSTASNNESSGTGGGWVVLVALLAAAYFVFKKFFR